MSDLFGPGFFFPGANAGGSGGGGSGGVSKELRQRIALAMLAQKRKFPTTLGEGLSAIGDSLGERGIMRQLAAEENAAFTGANTKADELLGRPSASAAQEPSPVQAAAISAPSPLNPMDQTPVPPTVQEGGPTPSPSPMFRPNLRTATPPAQALPPAAPAVPAPPDVPGATRMSTPEQLADFRAQNPLPQNIPPMPPPGGPPPGMPPQPAAPARPSVADYGQKLALAPTPQDPNASPLDNMPWPQGNVGAPPPGAPVMAQGPDPASLPMAPPDDPRRAIGLALMKQQMGGQGAPPPPPAPPPNQGIAAAPPAAPIQKMPAPAVPQGGYISPTPKDVVAPTPEPMSRQEAQMRDAIARDPDGVNGQLARRLGPVIKTLEDNRTAENARKIEQYKIDLQAKKAMDLKIEEQKGGAAKNIADVSQAQSQADVEATKARIVQRSGLTPDELYKRLDTEKQSADQAIKAQDAQQMARKAIKAGVITGYGADMRVAGAKFADFAFKNGMSSDMAANTEIMKAGLNAGLSEAIKTVNGEGGVGVSNTDVRIAQGIQGSDPNLQMKTIESIMDRAAEINHRKINRYEDYVDKTLSGEPSALRYQSSHGPTAPPDKIQMLAAAQDDPAKATEYRRYFDQVYGPGAAELELARLERARRKRGQ